jgi:type VI protein secretion system component VasF
VDPQVSTSTHERAEHINAGNMAHHYLAIIDWLLGMFCRQRTTIAELQTQVAYLERKIERYRREFMLPPYNGDRKEINR